MCRPKEYAFLSRFRLKTDIDFDHSPGMVFKGTTRAYKRMENGMFSSERRSGFTKKKNDKTEVDFLLSFIGKRMLIVLGTFTYIQAKFVCP